MKVKRVFVELIVVGCLFLDPSGVLAQGAGPQLVLLKQLPSPVLSIHSIGAEGNWYGFEAGQVVRLGNTYHLVISELFGDPWWVKMKLAHWKSTDGVHWERVSTLYTSSGEFEGKDPRASLWAPSVAYDEKEGRWNLFYVAYKCMPNTLTQWRLLFEARIWRAVSQTQGPEGIDGPYTDVDVIMEPGPDSDKWEGLQGLDSFFPYQVGDKWYAFYGSCNTEHRPLGPWRVGLASAPELAGPWKRLSDLNPVDIEKPFIEVPVVTRLDDGTYLAVYNTDSKVTGAIGYTFSSDGIHWASGRHLFVQPQGKGFWADVVRTPLCLIPEGSDTYTLLYSGFCSRKEHSESKSPGIFDHGDSALGLVTVKLLRSEGAGKP